MKITTLLCLLTILLLISCNRNKSEAIHERTTDTGVVLLTNMEDREDSVEMARSLCLQGEIGHKLTADTETQPVESLEGEDAADDPAIWINEKHPLRSLILGTNKTAGLYVYDLKGKAIQYRKSGRVNNVDLRDNFSYRGNNVVIVAASNRSNNSVSLYYIDRKTGLLSDTIKNIRSGVDEVYGVCLYRDITRNDFYVFVNGKGGLVEQWQISDDHGIDAEMKRNFRVNSQPEGMIAHDKKATLYFAVEEEGIFKIAANPDEQVQIIKIPDSDSANRNIKYDIEGLAVFTHKNSDYLVASSQGNFSYAIFELGETDEYVTSFVLTGGKIDAVEETDGLEIAVFPFGKTFPVGMLVVQDGYNYNGDNLVNQNFKYVSMTKILRLLE